MNNQNNSMCIKCTTYKGEKMLPWFFSGELNVYKCMTEITEFLQALCRHKSMYVLYQLQLIQLQLIW